MAVLEFKKRENVEKPKEKMSIVELLDVMVEQMLDFVAHYYDDFLTDGTYQVILSKQECKVMDDLVKKCSRDDQTLMEINKELKEMKEYQGNVVATYTAVSAFNMANETIQKINLINEEANGRIHNGDVNVAKFEVLQKIKARYDGQFDRIDYDSLEEASNGFYPFILVDIYYNWETDEDELYTIGFKNKTDALKYALSEGISGNNILQMWG